MVTSRRPLRAFALGAALSLAVAACGGGTSGSGQPGQSGAAPGKGGTLYLLSHNEEWNQIDPQRAYTGEDLAFFNGTIYRSLVAYKFSSVPAEANTLVPDMATDIGQHNADATQWKFTLRDGLTWQDGSPVKCQDVQYSVSRTFATDVINQGPTYAIAYLDIPLKADGQTSQYPGPYKATPAEQALYDKAVSCDGSTVTFKLSKPVPDFNFATTLGMFLVPNPKDHPGVDVGEQYGQPGHLPWSNGPYMVQSYSTGNGGKFVLVRNPKWNQSSDPYRHAYPDKWEVDFGIDAKVLDQRLMASAGNDAFGVQYGQVQPENLATIFTDPDHTTPQFNGRAISGFDPFSRYVWINVNKVKNVKIRQAMAVALDRQAIRLNIGGAFAGTLADGLIKPNIGQDYAPTGVWDGLYGEKVPDDGDPAFAKQLIEQSGESAPNLTYDFPDTPTQEKNAAIVVDSLGKAGFKVKANPIESGQYYSVVFDPQKAHELGYGGWGADWPSASTVIPDLLTVKGGWDLSQLDDPAFNAKVDDAQHQLDPAKRRAAWQALNKEAMQQAYVIPTIFGLSQDLAGNKVGSIYRWAPYGSWPYGDMYVKS